MILILKSIVAKYSIAILYLFGINIIKQYIHIITQY